MPMPPVAVEVRKAPRTMVQRPRTTGMSKFSVEAIAVPSESFT